MQKLCLLFNFEAKDDVSVVIQYNFVTPIEKLGTPPFIQTVKVQLML